MIANEATVNTDRTLWREVADDFYSPSIHVTADGGIGINVGGHVIVRTLTEWNRLHFQEEAVRRAVLAEVREKIEAKIERIGLDHYCRLRFDELLQELDNE